VASAVVSQSQEADASVINPCTCMLASGRHRTKWLDHYSRTETKLWFNSYLKHSESNGRLFTITVRTILIIHG